MLKAYKFRLKPDSEQAILLNKHFGCVRLVYNLALETKKLAYLSAVKKSLSYNDLAEQLKELKTETEWLNEVNSQSLQSSLRNLDTAYTNFFKHGSGFPKFKKRSNRQSFACPQNVEIDFKNNLIFLPKFKTGIPIVLHRKFKGEIRTVTISKTPTGLYFAAVLVDNKQELPAKPVPTKERSKGIDVGLISMAVIADPDLNNVTTVENPKWLLKKQHLLKRRSRQLSKKVKGSKNREKARLALARLHEKIARQRLDFTHKLTYGLTHDNQVDTICIEDLNIAGMVKNHSLAGAINAVAWGEMFRQLEYKSNWNGKNLLRAHPFSPSSKKCRHCGSINRSLTLKDRIWECPSCKEVNDRDDNSVPNIIDSAFEEYEKNRDGLPELTPDAGPVSQRLKTNPLKRPRFRARQEKSLTQEKF